jgi:hypothetical protein
MISRIFLVLAAMLLPAGALAQSQPDGLEGHWALRIDEATIFVFALDQAADGSWQGAWTRPAQIDSNGVIFRRMSGSQTVTPTDTRHNGEVVQLTFAGPPGTGRNDVLRIRQVGENQARMQYQGIPGDPYPLVRVMADTPLGPFEDMRIYDRDNAVTEADYVDADAAEVAPLEPLEALEPLADLGPMDEDELDALESAAGSEEATADSDDSEDESEAERPRITADFLDGI